MKFLGVLLLLCSTALGQFSVECPSKVDPYKVVPIQVTGEGSITIKILGKNNFLPVQSYKVDSQNTWVWTGPPDTYIVWVDCWKEGSVETFSCVCVIGAPNNPDTPDPDPNPIDPDIPDNNVPDGYLGFTKFTYENAPRHKESAQKVAANYEEGANRLYPSDPNMSSVSITQAFDLVFEANKVALAGIEDTWKPFSDKLSSKIKENWPMSKNQVAETFKAISEGLKKVK